jgi:hypothetical protein
VKRRSLITQACAAAAVIALGLASRRFPWLFPAALGKYPGDALWALAAFVVLGMVLPRASTWRVAALALATAFAVELGQLYHAPWIDAVRATTVGQLVLGSTFHAPDLVAYAVGVGIGMLAERLLDRRSSGESG